MAVKFIVVIVILSILLLVVLAKYILYRQQIINICRQIAFVRENDTNKVIYNDVLEHETLELAEMVNAMCEEHRAKENYLILKDKRLKMALAGVSHDIRTPLTSLKGYFELAVSEENEEKKRQYNEVITSKLEELTELLDELFMYTKLQDEEYSLELGSYDFSKLVPGALFLFYDEFKKRNIEMDIDVDENPAIILCNEVAVKRLISNILRNAMLHGNGKISVKYKVKDDGVEFCCKNNITEWEKIDVTQVFDRFYKADDARGKGSTGLGLSIAKELTGRMGGSISASIEDGWFLISLGFTRCMIYQ